MTKKKAAAKKKVAKKKVTKKKNSPASAKSQTTEKGHGQNLIFNP